MPFIETTVVEQKLFDGATVADNILNGKKAISTMGTGTARDEQPGRFYDFDGSDDVVVAPAGVSTAIQSNDVGTISLWFNRDVQEVTTLFGATDSGDADSILTISNTATGGIRFLITEAGSTILDVTTTADFAPTTWYHVVVTMGASGISIYVNGALQTLAFATGSQSTQEWFNSVNNIDDVALGSHKVSSSYTDNFNGQIFDVKVFDTELTNRQVVDVFNFESTVATRLHNKCDDVHDTVAYDSSGNGYHGVKIGITPATFHGKGSDVPYSYQNEIGFSDYTNVLQEDSEDFTNWTMNSISITQDAKVDPDGNTNAWKLAKTDSGSSKFIYSLLNSSLENVAVYYECWLNSGTIGDAIQIGIHGAGFQMRNAEILEGTGNATVSISANRLNVTNITDWVKVRASSLPINGSSIQVYHYPGSPSETTSGYDVYAYHPHVYISGTNSTYIHTEEGTVVNGNIPRNEALPALNVITGDVTSSLQYTGQVPRNGELIESACGTFDATNDYVATTETGGVLNISNNLSVFARATSDVSDVVGNDTIIAKHDGGGADHQAWKMYFSSGELLNVAFGDATDGTGLGIYSSDSALVPDTISSCGFTFDDGVVELYSDGLNIAGSTTSGTIPSTLYSTGTAPVLIGASFITGAVEDVWDGIIYDSQIYDTTILTSSGMLYLHTQGESGIDPGTGNLVGNWPISENSNDIVHDVSINANHGTINNATTTVGAGFWGRTQNEFHYSVTQGFTTGTGPAEVPARIDGLVDASGNTITNPANLFNGSITNINFIPVASPRSIRVYRGYATVTTNSIIDFLNLTGVTVDSYTVPNGLVDPLPSVSSNQIVFASTGDLSQLILSDGTELALYKNAIDSAGSNHGVASGVTFATYSVDTSYAFGTSPVGLTKVEAFPNESCLQYASTTWTFAAATTSVIETHPYIFYQIGNFVVTSTPERRNGHFTGFSNTIQPMSTHADQFRRNDGDTI